MSAEDSQLDGDAIREHLARAEEWNQDALERIAERMLRVISADGLIFTAGTGHSVALILETFYRAGGLACVYPIFHPALLPLEGGAASTHLERTTGLAGRLVEVARPTPNDLAFIFSNSGVNAVPVELAQEMRSKGTAVIAVVSLPHLRRAPARMEQKLDACADDVLDTLVPYGDASYALDGISTAPLSSLTGIFFWNLLLIRLAKRAKEQALELPIWVSSNVEGGDERNRALFTRYGPRIPAL